MRDVAENVGSLSLGGDGEALMAGGVARGGDDGDFVGEVEFTVHEADVVQLFDESTDGLGLVENFYRWGVDGFTPILTFPRPGGREFLLEEEVPVGLGDDVFGVGEGGSNRAVGH